MNTEIILSVSRATLEGTMAFPDVVARLVEAGVESYHVDYVSRRKTFYGAAGDTASTPVDFESLQPVAEDFCGEAVRTAILDSQLHGQNYRDFTRRVMEAGVQGYFAFLRGKRVTYLGRQGDQHTEWFPGAGPATDSSRSAPGADLARSMPTGR